MASALPFGVRPPTLHLSAQPQQKSRKRLPVTTAAAGTGTARKLRRSTSSILPEPLVVSLQDFGGGLDTWRLDCIIKLLQDGGVGIIPTDSLPALVADINNRDAVARLYAIKGASPKKPMSVLCRNLADIGHYTTGFPPALQPGEPDIFSRVKKILPGPYTIILPASKALPKVVVDPARGKSKHRAAVGVRWPANDVCQYLLDGLQRPLLSTSVEVDDDHRLSADSLVPDTGTLLAAYTPRGIDFVVDVPPWVATVSTVVDMTSGVPEVVRRGRGDASMFERPEE